MEVKEITKKSILAGILIGLGVIINLQTEIPLVGAILFSFGLITIIYMQLNLYTGKIGFFKSWKQIPYFLAILIFNFIGISLMISLYSIANKDFIEIITAAATIKFSKSILTLFINAFFCGILIHFAVKNKQTIITLFAVIIFILIKAEHCIADFPYLIFNLSILNTLKFISIIIGNSLGAIFIERLNK